MLIARNRFPRGHGWEPFVPGCFFYFAGATKVVEEILARVNHIVFKKDDFVIAKAYAGVNTLSLTGEDPMGEIQRGAIYRFMGSFGRHPKYGPQFKFDSFAPHLEPTREGITIYLEKFADGVGPTTAIKLWDAFGHEAVDILTDEPDRAAQSGAITLKTAQAASESLKQQRQFRSTHLDLIAIFAGLGLPRQLPGQCIQKWGAAAPETVRQNPFLLMEFPRCGFSVIDRLHFKLNRPGDDPNRLMYGLIHLIDADRNGNTWLLEDELKPKFAQLVGLYDPCYFDFAQERAAENKLIYTATNKNQHYVAMASLARDETAVRDNLQRLLADRSPLIWPDPAELTDLSEHQQAMLKKAFQGRVSILAGVPGTGKTRTAASVIKWLIQKDYSLAVCAPTGKAAVRITSSLQECEMDVTATTIHRLLGIKFIGGAMGFQFNENDPLPCDVVVVDELSMLDTNLAAALLRACGDSTHLLMVGDPYQLSPVGHGAPLRDMMAADIPTGELSEIWRNSGLIVEACWEIKNGFRFKAADNFDGLNNLRVIDTADEQDTLDMVKIFASKLVERHAQDPIAAMHPVADVQFLCVVNENTKLSRAALNRILQHEFNPNGAGVPTHHFRVGDKVMITNNSFHPKSKLQFKGHPATFSHWEQGDPELRSECHFIANGDVGVIQAISEKAAIVRFANPDRVAAIDLNCPPLKDGEIRNEINGLTLAYAITVHKSQGSDWPMVVIVADPSERAKTVVGREFIYTAISRAKKKCLILGKRDVVDEWCQKLTLRRRTTLLAERLKGEVP